MKHSPSLAPTSCQPHRVATHATLTSSNDQHHQVTLEDIYKKLVEVLTAIVHSKVDKKAIRLPDVKELTGASRSQIYALMNPKCSAYSPSFPRPFHIGNSTRWWEHEIRAWLDDLAATTATRH